MDDEAFIKALYDLLDKYQIEHAMLLVPSLTDDDITMMLKNVDILQLRLSAAWILQNIPEPRVLH